MHSRLKEVFFQWRQENKDSGIKDKTVCFFRFQSIEDGECAYEALATGNVVFLDLSLMQEEQNQRMKDYMRGVSVSLKADMHEICEDYIAYFPSGYHLQILES